MGFSKKSEYFQLAFKAHTLFLTRNEKQNSPKKMESSSSSGVSDDERPTRDPVLRSPAAAGGRQHQRTARGPSISFPMKLHRMLQQAEERGFQDVVTWLPGGVAFKIHDPEGMVSVLRMFFKQTRYKSFLRQIQNYGFHRVTRGPTKGVCTHKLFIRDAPLLCLEMNRAQSAGMDSSVAMIPRTVVHDASSSSTTTTGRASPVQSSPMVLLTQHGPSYCGVMSANNTAAPTIRSTNLTSTSAEDRCLAPRLRLPSATMMMDMKEKQLWSLHNKQQDANIMEKEISRPPRQAQQYEQETHKDDSSWLTKLLENQERWMTASNNITSNNANGHASLDTMFEPNHIIFPTL
jgi:hypothetical protein